MGRILVIDDDEASRDILVRRLKRSGYRAVAAQDGETGIEEALEIRPDLVLVDIRLGKIDGWEVIRRIRAQRGSQEPKFISMTAFDPPDFIPRSAELGCSHAFCIPYSYDRLLACVAGCMAGRTIAGNGNPAF